MLVAQTDGRARLRTTHASRLPRKRSLTACPYFLALRILAAQTCTVQLLAQIKNGIAWVATLRGPLMRVAAYSSHTPKHPVLPQ
jgi:hypothetical protein